MEKESQIFKKKFLGKRLQFQTTQSWRNKHNARSSYKERRVNALALGAEEGRGKQRNASGSRKQTTIRG